MATHDSEAMKVYTRKYADGIESVATAVKDLANRTVDVMDENDAPAVRKIGDELITSVNKALEIPRDIHRQMEEATKLTAKLDEAQGGAR